MFRFLPLIAVLCAGCTLSGQTTDIVVGEKTLVLSVPSGYSELPRDADQPDYATVFEIAKIEEWERINEFNEEMIVLGFEYATQDQAAIDASFDTLFTNVVGFAQAKVDNTSFSPAASIAGAGAYQWLTTRTPVAVAQSVRVTENSAKTKSIEVIASFEMPGVVTYPLVSEVSFVLIRNRLIIAHATRVNFEDSVSAELRATGSAFRSATSALNGE